MKTLIHVLFQITTWEFSGVCHSSPIITLQKSFRTHTLKNGFGVPNQKTNIAADHEILPDLQFQGTIGRMNIRLPNATGFLLKGKVWGNNTVT